MITGAMSFNGSIFGVHLARRFYAIPQGDPILCHKTGMIGSSDLLRTAKPRPTGSESRSIRLIRSRRGSASPLTYRRPSPSDIRIGGFVILPQRVPYPVFRQKDPLQIGVPREANSEEVIDLPLVPVGCDPEIGRADV